MHQRLAILRDRSFMFSQVRDFFSKRKILEVDCPALSHSADIAVHIDPITATYNGKETCYLHPSPEYGMKKLLSEGLGDIYQLSHVFRDGEYSSKHNPEFMMVEWYRQNIPFLDFVDETFDFMTLFLGSLPRKILSYREAFLQYAGFDYLEMNISDLLAYISSNNLDFSPDLLTSDKDSLLNLILASHIEPHLGCNELCALTYYPSSQASLAQVIQRGEEFAAERFEIYYQGIELCNGFHELTDLTEQRKRLHEANQERLRLGKTVLPIDETFLAALEKGLPDSCGVAAGFDRLMMLRHKKSDLSDVIAFRARASL